MKTHKFSQIQLYLAQLLNSSKIIAKRHRRLDLGNTPGHTDHNFKLRELVGYVDPTIYTNKDGNWYWDNYVYAPFAMIGGIILCFLGNKYYGWTRYLQTASVGYDLGWTIEIIVKSHIHIQYTLGWNILFVSIQIFTPCLLVLLFWYAMRFEYLFCGFYGFFLLANTIMRLVHTIWPFTIDESKFF